MITNRIFNSMAEAQQALAPEAQTLEPTALVRVRDNYYSVQTILELHLPPTAPTPSPTPSVTSQTPAERAFHRWRHSISHAFPSTYLAGTGTIDPLLTQRTALRARQGIPNEEVTAAISRTRQALQESAAAMAAPQTTQSSRTQPCFASMAPLMPLPADAGQARRWILGGVDMLATSSESVSPWDRLRISSRTTDYSRVLAQAGCTETEIVQALQELRIRVTLARDQTSDELRNPVRNRTQEVRESEVAMQPRMYIPNLNRGLLTRMATGLEDEIQRRQSRTV